MAVAIIGGSGFSKQEFFKLIEKLDVETEFGKVSVYRVDYDKLPLYFLPRHGGGHQIPPHLVNYKGNIKALKKIGVSRIISTTAVGTMNAAMEPGTFAIPDQFIDMTKGRDSTYSKEGYVIHVDMTEPFCPEVRRVISEAFLKRNLKVSDRATYVVTEGPRFETPAEINAYKILGGDLVGMTLSPECVLARELEICYATLSLITNYAAGISQKPLSAKEVDEMMVEKGKILTEVILDAVSLIPEKPACQCQKALSTAEP